MLTLSKIEGVLKQSSTGRKDTSSKNKDKYKVVNENQLVCNSMHMWEGTCGVSDYVGIVSPAYDVFLIKSGFNIYFLKQLLKTKNMINIFDVNSYGMSYSKRTLTPKTFLDITVSLPSTKEQNKIATHLTNIDKDLKTKNTSLENLKLWKKSLLQKMFV